MSTERSSLPAKCMKCEANLAFPIVCSGCQTLYPRPQTADYFDLLGLERCYAVDEAKLEAACRALTRNVHPDRFTGQPDEVRAMATRLSAEVNQAVDVLRDPVRRADYMLELAGGPSAAEVHDVPGDLLMEVMTLREQIEEARAQSDAEALDRVRTTVTTKRTDTMSQISARVDHLATSDTDAKQEVRRLLNSIKYFDNLLAELVDDPLAAQPDEEDA